MSRGCVPLVLALLAAAPGGAWQGPAAGAALAIIVNRANPVDALTFSELRRIFLLETQSWPHGRRITLVLREPGQPERAAAVALITGMTEAEFDRHVLFQTFRGRIGWGPRAISSAASMRRFVFNAPGAVGYVYHSELDDTVKALRIDGVAADDPGYRLRIVP
jgi:phosphate transport system substrate-binding protein